MDRRFFRLQQFLGGYLNEGWPYVHGTPERAVETAIDECPIELRQQVRRELHAVLSEVTDDKEFLEVLNLGLGVNVHFKRPEEARTFAEGVEAKLMRSIKEHFGNAIDSRG